MKKNIYVKNKPEDNLSISKKDLPKKGIDPYKLQKWRNILEQDGEKYSDAEIELIYCYLYEMADMSVTRYIKTRNYEESNSNVES